MHPVEALERIAYLLDRSAAPAHRTRAFLRAADAVRPLTDAQLRSRAEAGTLRELEHVGEVTERVITEALAGEVPAYLARLEGSTELELTSAGARLRDALRGDCHSHTRWSDGGASLEVMARTARDLGHEYLVVTDHSPRLTIAHGLSPERLREQLALVERVNEELAPFRVLTGSEVDILDDGSLDLPDDVLAGLDVVVASLHSKLRMDRDAMTRRMCRAVANPHVDVLGHCTGRLVRGRGRPESAFDPELVFHACQRFDTAVEINSRPDRLDPPRRLLGVALELGCRFAVDSDAHAPGQLEWQAHGCNRAGECGVPPERIVNTGTADELLAWAGAHAG